MNHPILISCRGKAFRERVPHSSLKEISKLISSWNLSPQTIVMSEADFNDIKCWVKST